MKKRLLSLVLVGIMTVTMLTACGSKETTTEAPVEETTVEETTEEPVEEETAEVIEDSSTDTTLGYVKEDITEEEPEEANTEEFNQDVAMKKVERAIDCYRKLVETEDEETWNLIDGMERLGTYRLYMDLRTSDGYYVYSDDGYVTDTAAAAMGNIYYDYANGIVNEVTPMSEYIPSQTNDEILNKHGKASGTGNSDDMLMYTAITFMNYLNRAETIEAGDFIKLDTPAFVVNGTMNAVYKMPLIVDGEDSRLYAAFDENGMLIQISNEEDYDSNKIDILTFPEQQ